MSFILELEEINMRRLDLGIYENIIEVSWMFKDLIAAGEIKSWDDLMDELPTGSDAIKETIMQIAEDFEKEYNIDDWNETDMQYLTEITKYSEKRLLEEYGIKKDLDISNLKHALNKIRQVKDRTLKKPMDRAKYRQLCNCEGAILDAMDVINMMNSGNFDIYYHE